MTNYTPENFTHWLAGYLEGAKRPDWKIVKEQLALVRKQSKFPGWASPTAGPIIGPVVGPPNMGPIHFNASIPFPAPGEQITCEAKK